MEHKDTKTQSLLLMEHKDAKTQRRKDAKFFYLCAAFVSLCLCVQFNQVSSGLRVEEIFLGFLGLLPQHFEEHHDIGFYASELCITTTYLSRVVRQVSGGRTVVDYINQMLLMEATFLLRQTSLSITQIAVKLHFAEVTTFARFFNRMKGMNPREFRKGK
jgi:AraC-like DNA-binding protein